MLHQPFNGLINVGLILAGYAVDAHLPVLQCLHAQNAQCVMCMLAYERTAEELHCGRSLAG